MRIEQELKLGFKDVLFRPKRSTLKSRSQVNLTREFTFKHSGRQWSGVPVIAANMDSVGSFAMAKALAEHGVMTAVHKHYTVADWAEFVKSADKATLNNVMVSTGTSEADFQKTKDVMALSDELIFICIDIANGYSEHLVEYVQRVRAAFPDKVISAGNVVTGDMVEELILAGADIVKVGIGPGSV
ncbi:IMP dehydrogenase, partial [Vibrio cholerae]